MRATGRSSGARHLQKWYNIDILGNLFKVDDSDHDLEESMQHAVRTISSSDAKANLGDVLSSLNSHGPVEITRNGKSVGLLTLPAVQAVDRSRMSALAIAYSKGLISWPQIAEETGASYGDLLVALGLKNLQIPQVTPKNRPEQMAFFNHILDLAAAKSKGNQ